MKKKFIKGLVLNESFYNDVVKHIIESNLPNIDYSAGLIGYGSDVLGFDTHISIDHNWGPRLILFLSEKDYDQYERKINNLLRTNLPYDFKGFSTNFTSPLEDGVQRMETINKGEVNHLIEITSISSFLKRSLGIGCINNIRLLDWLKFTNQGLIEVTKGKIYYDGLKKLKKVRDYFRFYPDDILRLKLASLWHYIAQEEAFVGRNVDLGEELGVKLITSRIVTALIKICFYIEKEYIPYSKWFSRSFKELKCYNIVNEHCMKIINCNDINKIEELLCKAYKKVLLLQNKLDLTDEIVLDTTDFYGRPYKVIFTSRITECLINSIESDELKKVKIDYLSLIENNDGIDLTNNLNLLKELFSVNVV